MIHVDGSVERYGYPATPSLAEMDKKYGPLPYYMRTNERPVNTGYLARWAAISAEAEREFHPKSGNPKAIIFPGDSRVIAVDATGKATVYDMDNTVDPKERRGFELLYGNLPNCVPEKGGVPPVPVFRKPAPAVDTTPLTPGTKTSTTTATPATAMAKAGDSTPKSPLPPGYQPVAMLHGNPIYIVDGKRMPDSANVLQHLNPDTIESITVLKTRAATAQYGPDAAARGVLLITLKKPQKQP